jgi:hypothetical protein
MQAIIRLAISSASHEAAPFTDGMNRLSPQLSADVSKYEFS